MAASFLSSSNFQPFIKYKNPSSWTHHSMPRHHNRRHSFIVLSMNTKPTILVSEKLGEARISLLKTFANVDCSYNLTHEDLCTKSSLCDALVVRSGTKVTHEVFESSLGSLKVVGRAGVGIDNVDLAAATEHGCLVVNAPNANTVAPVGG